MKNSVILFFTLFVASCSQPSSINTAEKSVNVDSLRTELLSADKAWNDDAAQKGYFHSRVDFVDDNGIELDEGEMPIAGKQAITDYLTTHSDSAFKIQWMAEKAEVAASGDMGYTYGSYWNQTKTKNGKDTTLYGAYITVWKKQADGSWKFAADVGVSTPMQVK